MREGRHAEVRLASSFERAKAALKQLGRPCRMDRVEYYDEKTFHGFFELQDVPFRKRLKFQPQREYRIAIAGNLDAPGPFTLEVGDLSDIAKLTTPSEFNERLRIELPDGTSA